MATMHVAAEGTAEGLLAAVKRLPPDQVRKLAQQFVEWHERNGKPDQEEAALIEATRARLPAADDRRLRRLGRKTERETLTPKELADYQALAQRAEEIDVVRAQALAELVRRRGKPVRVVMEEIGWKSGSDGT